jgi:hypothetical protein
MTTIKASFGGWIPLVNFDDGSAIPLCFVLQLPDELTPLILPRISGRVKSSDILFQKEEKGYAKGSKDLYDRV